MYKKIIDYIENHKTLVTLLILAFPVLILTPSKIGIFQKEDAQTIVSYFGSIIGGSLTLVGVWWTIKDQNEKRKKDIAIQYKPFINIYMSQDRIEKEPIIEYKGKTSLNMSIKNIGRGEALECKAYSNDIKVFSSSCIPSGIEFDLPISCGRCSDDKVLTLCIEYYDLYKEKKYIVTAKIKVKYRNNKISQVIVESDFQ